MPHFGCQENKMKKIREQSGASLIEFVIVLIPLLVLLFASIEFGVAGYNKAMITNASREGARAGIVFDASNPPTNRISEADISQVVINYCKDNLITFGPVAVPDIDVDRTGVDPGDNLTVSVEYQYGFLFLQNLIIGFKPTINLNAVSIMRME
jgi:Flp pilus assembly protein TadG